MRRLSIGFQPVYDDWKSALVSTWKFYVAETAVKDGACFGSDLRPLTDREGSHLEDLMAVRRLVKRSSTLTPHSRSKATLSMFSQAVI